MDKEKKLEEELRRYQELAKENKNIDASSLMSNALQNRDKQQVSSRWKKWAYLVSVAAPPLGLVFALKFYLGSEDDGKRVAGICIILTIFSGVFFLIIFQMFLSGVGGNLDQIQQIKPQDIQQLLE